MKKVLGLLALIISVNISAQYSININLKDGDCILYHVPGSDRVDNVVNGFGYSFGNKVMAEQHKLGNKPLPLIWYDFNDTTSIKYYEKGGKFYVYEIVDKSFGKNNAIQPNEIKRPLYDRTTGMIYYPEGTELEYNVTTPVGTLTGVIDKQYPSSLYFILFINTQRHVQI